MKQICWECNKEAYVEHHHPIPRSRGGTKTIPLCSACHSLAHNTRIRTDSLSQLIKEGMARRKKMGYKFGNPNVNTNCRPRGLETIKRNAASFNARIQSVVNNLRAEGYMSTIQLVNQLNELGIKNRSGRPWTYHNLYRVLACKIDL